MKCKNCGNSIWFTMIKETAHWNAGEKKFEDAGQNADEYYVCDTCMRHNEEGKHIDTEGEY